MMTAVCNPPYANVPAVYAKTFGIPREENKTLIGAVLAVLGVNAVRILQGLVVMPPGLSGNSTGA